MSLKLIEITLVFRIFKKLIFLAKTASELRGPMLTAPTIIKNSTNCRARFFTKLLFEKFLCFANLDRSFIRTTVFDIKKIIFQFDSYFAFAAIVTYNE